jgi:RNA polymerase sigma factor (sigma-70 family)
VKKSDYKKYTDPELIALCLEGDALAWETLIVSYRRLVYSVPARFGFKGADAADIFQAACVKLLEHLHELKDDRKLSLWLMKTTIRMCIQLKAQKTRDSGTEDEVEEPLDPTENLEELQIGLEKQQSIREAVDELPERCRSLIEMLYFSVDPVSYDEIGEKLGMPEPSVGPNRARCLEKLRAKLLKRGINKA